MKKKHFCIILIFIVIGCTSTPTNKKNIQHQPKEKVDVEHFIAPNVPTQLVFAGDTLFFNDLDVKERMDRELIVNKFWHSQTLLILKKANRWFPLMKKILKEKGVPEDLIYIAVAESGLANVTSYAGAKGFWQFMKPTAKEHGLIVNDQVDERYNVEKSTHAACDYLLKAKKELGTWILAAAAYNRGVKGIKDNLKRQQVKSFFDLSLVEETARYVFRVLAFKLILETPIEFGFSISPNQLYPPYQTKDVVVDSTIENLYDWSINNGITIKILRKLNPWLKGRSLTIKGNKKFIFKLPKNDKQLSIIGVN